MFAVAYAWWFWMFLMLMLLMPVGYGWGYRGWGAPVPSYVQRRRVQVSTSAGVQPGRDHLAWGWGGDFIWALFVIEIIFCIALFIWR